MSLSEEVLARIEQKKQAALAIKRKREEEAHRAGAGEEAELEVSRENDAKRSVDSEETRDASALSCQESVCHEDENNSSSTHSLKVRVCGKRVDKVKYIKCTYTHTQ